MSCSRCNRTGTCKNCVCKKAGKLCSRCLPGKLGNCANQSATDLPGLSQASSWSLAPAPPTSLHRLPSGSQPSVASTGSARQPPPAVSNCQPLSTIQPPSSTFLVNPLPTQDSILRVRLSTLQHVPRELGTLGLALLPTSAPPLGRTHLIRMPDGSFSCSLGIS